MTSSVPVMLRAVGCVRLASCPTRLAVPSQIPLRGFASPPNSNSSQESEIIGAINEVFAGLAKSSASPTPPLRSANPAFQYLPGSPFDVNKRKPKRPPPFESGGGFGSPSGEQPEKSEQIAEYSDIASRMPEPWTKLRYLPLYPIKVRRWVLDAKSRMGRYLEDGRWHVDIADDIHAAAPDSILMTIAGKAIIEAEMERRKQQAALGFEPPADLVGRYRFGVTEEMLDAVNAPEKVRHLLSMTNAPSREVRDFRVQELMQKVRRHEFDCGSSEAQIAALTERINAITVVLSANKKDKHLKHRMTQIVAKRVRLMKYLRRTKPEAYFKTIVACGLKDIGPPLTRAGV
eukprot:TRINITY_DN31798_c0_g1_i1.p1 TRINITY_DN31798_c0_g1~~TRINITY_DN31798_c0_g1_i1.p1  ORF type:complete len:346 (+),score=32.00 TRINITY_DN31798_c0_g1_i1:84-1121(+)